MNPDGAPARPRRRLGRWLLLAAGLVIAAAWLAGPAIVQPLIARRLATAGASGAMFDVRRVGPFETRIEGFRLAGVTADRIFLRYTPWAVFRGDIHSLVLEGLAIRGPAGATALAAARAEETLRTADGLRIAHIVFGEAKLALAVPGGDWEASLRGSLAEAPSGALDGAISVVATSAAGAFGGELRLAPGDDGRTEVRLELREAALRLPGLTLEPLAGEIAVARSDGPLPRLGVDLEMGGAFAGGGGGIERARLRLASEGAGAAASFAGIDRAGRRFTIEGAADATAGPDGIQLRLSRPGSVSFLGLPARGTPTVLEGRIEPGDAPAARLVVDEDGIRLVHALRLALRPATVATVAGPARIEGGRISVDGRLGPEGPRGSAVLRVPLLALPQAGIAAEDAALAVRWEEGPARFELTAAAIRSTAVPPWFATLPLAVAGTAGASGVAFDGKLGGPSAVTVEIAGEAGWTGDGRARLRLRPVDLAMLGRLSPALAETAREAGGLAAARAELRWNADGPEGTGQVLLRDVAAALPFGRIAGVSGVVALDRLVPPSTAGPQALAVGSADIGLPLSAGTVSFRLDDGRPALAGARFRIGGIAATLAGSTLSPGLDRALLHWRLSGDDGGLVSVEVTGAGSRIVAGQPPRETAPADGPYPLPEAIRRQIEAYGTP